MALQFELAGSQIDGTRGYQEDAFLITHLTDDEGNPSALVIVADGMGGHAAGNVASNMAVQAFNKHVSANYPTDAHATILRECVEMANNSIKETVAETPALSGMGCTMVAAILEKGHMWWASVGDSHVYLLRDKELIKKNADHSYGGFLDRMEAAGTPVEPEPGLARNMLMSAITGEDLGEVDVPEQPFELQSGDKILICSDGMDTLSAGKIIQFSDWSESPKECADDLLKAVEDAGMPKQDNTTIVVVNVTEAEQAAAPEPAAEPAPAAEEEIPTVEENIGDATQEISSSDLQQPQKSKTGMLIGIAALVLIGIGVGVFMSMGGKDSPAPASSVADQETEISEQDDSDIYEDEEAEESITATDEEQQAVEEEVAVAVTAEAAPQSGTISTSANEFRDKLEDGSLGPVMVNIAKGEFDMGSPNSSRMTDERPRRTVKVRRFAISKYEVTFSEYEKFAKASGRRIPDNLYMDKDTHPVIFVSWDDAYYYTKWLSKQTGQRYRLPTESEWEYAAGTGKRSPFWWGFNEEPERAHCFGCGSGLDPRKPTKVGSFGANPFGLHDTAGNVAEWVHDCWHDNYKDAPSDSGVWEGGDCAFRIVRGGAYSSPPQSIRHAKRDKFKSDQMYDHIGIRLVRDPE